jgi:hypothetical protein
MNPALRNTLLAVLTATFVILGTGCETLHPQGLVMEPVENCGGSGGDAS